LKVSLRTPDFNNFFPEIIGRGVIIHVAACWFNIEVNTEVRIIRYDALSAVILCVYYVAVSYNTQFYNDEQFMIYTVTRTLAGNGSVRKSGR
jgi:hypothetical protein